MVRRFHDTGRQMLIPVIYFAVLIVTNIMITLINAMDPEYANISSIITADVDIYHLCGIRNILFSYLLFG
ncbi:hypothetical protein ABLV94_08815 [Staphylococcus sp. Mo2-7]